MASILSKKTDSNLESRESSLSENINLGSSGLGGTCFSFDKQGREHAQLEHSNIEMLVSSSDEPLKLPIKHNSMHPDIPTIVSNNQAETKKKENATQTTSHDHTQTVNWEKFLYNATVGVIEDLAFTAYKHPVKTALAVTAGAIAPVGLLALGVSASAVSSGIVAASLYASILKISELLSKVNDLTSRKISAEDFENSGKDFGYAVLSIVPFLRNKSVTRILGKVSRIVPKFSEKLFEKVMRITVSPKTNERFDKLIDKIMPKLYNYASDAQMGSFTNDPHRIMKNADKIDRIKAAAEKIYRTTYSAKAKDFLIRANSQRIYVSRLPWETY